jgi:hypothetical protein
MKIVKLEFSLQDLQIIAEALREMPYKTVVGLLQNIDQQVQPQLIEKPHEE